MSELLCHACQPVDLGVPVGDVIHPAAVMLFIPLFFANVSYYVVTFKL